MSYSPFSLGGRNHRRRNKGAEGAAAPLIFRAGWAMPPNFDRKMHFKNILEVLFSFEKGIFRIKWPKSEEKLEFGG